MESKSTVCEICSGSQELLYADVKNQEGWIDCNFSGLSAYQCKYCGLIEFHPQICENLENLYPNDYLDRGNRGRIHQGLLNLAEILEVRRLKRMKEVRILDYGSGGGEWVSRATKGGLDVFGYEPFTKNTTRRIVNDFSDLPDSNEFSLVRLEHVIEHFIDLEPHLQQIRRILAPEGIVQITTPDAESISRKLFGRYWGYLHVPHHTRIFSEKSLTAVMEASGFEKINKTVFPLNLCTAISLENLVRLSLARPVRGHLSIFPGLLIIGLLCESLLRLVVRRTSAMRLQFKRTHSNSLISNE